MIVCASTTFVLIVLSGIDYYIQLKRNSVMIETSRTKPYVRSNYSKSKNLFIFAACVYSNSTSIIIALHIRAIDGPFPEPRLYQARPFFKAKQTLSKHPREISTYLPTSPHSHCSSNNVRKKSAPRRRRVLIYYTQSLCRRRGRARRRSTTRYTSVYQAAPI